MIDRVRLDQLRHLAYEAALVGDCVSLLPAQLIELLDELAGVNR